LPGVGVGDGGRVHDRFLRHVVGAHLVEGVAEGGAEEVLVGHRRQCAAGDALLVLAHADLVEVAEREDPVLLATDGQHERVRCLHVLPVAKRHTVLLRIAGRWARSSQAAPTR
jgi:hypothetical protein